MKKAGIESDYETEKLNADSIAISDAELCALLANALDNAIEGTQRLLDGEPKKIFVRIRQTECALEITVRNPCEAKQTVAAAFIQSARRAARKPWLRNGQHEANLPRKRRRVPPECSERGV